VGPAVVPEQEIQAVREGLGEGLDEDLEALGMQLRQFQEKPFTGRQLHRAIDREPCKDVLHRAHGLHAIGGEAPAADGEAAKAAFVLAKDADGPGVRRGDRPLELCLAGGLEGGDGLRLFWCDWAAAL
jgi:hypothetical protein